MFKNETSFSENRPEEDDMAVTTCLRMSLMICYQSMALTRFKVSRLNIMR